MQLRSDAFENGKVIPKQFTCDGEDMSPPLDWNGVPAGTLSFVLFCHDPDAPSGIWHHWAAYDIPAQQREFAPGAAQDSERQGLKQGINDFHRSGYGGPCPPRGHGPHHYHFHLLALSTAHLPVSKTPSCQDVEREARKHLLTEARLVGIYER